MSDEEPAVDPPASGRVVRRYQVVRGRLPVLAIEGRKGRLYSLATLPEGMVAPEHPWLDGVSFDAANEHPLRLVMLASRDFDDFLARLVAAGYDLAADSGAGRRVLPTPQHLFSGTRAVAALWPTSGQLSSLGFQPEGEASTFAHALATAYAPEVMPHLQRALAATTSFEALLAALADSGLTLQPGAPEVSA